MFVRQLLLSGVSAILLFGCAHLQRIQTTQPPQTIAELNAHASWQLKGKVSINHATLRGIVRIQWRQEGDNYQIYLTAPLNQGWVSLSKQGDTIQLKDSDGNYRTGDDAVKLLLHYYHIPLPITAFRYWLIGLPMPSGSFSKHDTPNDPVAQLKQNGWTIHYKQFISYGALKLPKRIQFIGPETTMTLIISQWRL